jgi:hypothetical protein
MIMCLPGRQIKTFNYLNNPFVQDLPSYVDSYLSVMKFPTSIEVSPAIELCP